MGVPESLLPVDALAGVRLGISVSESPDLPRLGLLEEHFRLALGEIARCVLVSSGKLTYGGHLQPDGYTAFLIQELERYSRRDRPLRVCLSWTEHRRLTLSALAAEKRDLGLYGEIICLDPAGNAIDPAAGREEAPPAELDDETRVQSLTALRRYLSANTCGRVLIGGRRTAFQGAMPGLVEEALYAIEQGQPIYLAGGFGGITSDIARVVGVDDGAWLPTLPDAPAQEESVGHALERLRAAVSATHGRSFENGLTEEENKRLAACHRPSEIAALVSLGLGRRFAVQPAGGEADAAARS